MPISSTLSHDDDDVEDIGVRGMISISQFVDPVKAPCYMICPLILMIVMVIAMVMGDVLGMGMGVGRVTMTMT